MLFLCSLRLCAVDGRRPMPGGCRGEPSGACRAGDAGRGEPSPSALPGAFCPRWVTQGVQFLGPFHSHRRALLVPAAGRPGRTAPARLEHAGVSLRGDRGRSSPAPGSAAWLPARDLGPSVFLMPKEQDIETCLFGPWGCVSPARSGPLSCRLAAEPGVAPFSTGRSGLGLVLGWEGLGQGTEGKAP